MKLPLFFGIISLGSKKARITESGEATMKKPIYLQITVIVLTALLFLFACLPFWTGPASLVRDLLHSGFILVTSFYLVLFLILICILPQRGPNLKESLFSPTHAYRGPPEKTA